MKPFELDRLLTGDLPWHFLWEVAVRSAVMFIILLLTLRLTGKRGVRQLSVFETVIIIALGSAAGDPMFYEDVGLVPALTVFLVVIMLYRLVTWLTGKSKKFEHFIEGKTECIIVDGKFAVESFGRESLAQDEFFAELRMKSIEHLGQVKYAYLETSGEVSVFFFDTDQIKYGLPILPQQFQQKSELIVLAGIHACTSCGQTEELSPGVAICAVCNNNEWVAAQNTKRIT